MRPDNMRPGNTFGPAWAFAAVLWISPQVAQAKEEIRTSADVSATGGYSNNPFSEIGGDTGSTFAQINVRPSVKLLNETSQFTLNGLYNYQHYFRRYSDKSEYQAGLDYLGRPNSRLTTHANVQYDSSIVGGSIVGGLDNIGVVSNPTQPPPPVTTGTDLSLFGNQQRRRALDALADASFQMTSRDTLAINGFYDVVRYSGNVATSNYDGYGGGANYSRRVSAHRQIGLQASVARYVYQGTQGDSQVYSVDATINQVLSSLWNLQGSLGVSYSDRTIGGKKTYLSGNLNLCRTTVRTTLCVTARRAVLPTGINGTVATLDVGANYSYRLSEKSMLTFAADYLSNGGQQSVLANNSKYFNATLNYDRQLKERVRLIGTALYRKITGGNISRTADYGATLGVAVRLGDYR
jgi:hypothetical protein